CRVFTEPPQDLKISHGFRTTPMDRLLQINFRPFDLALPDNRRIDRFVFPIGPAPDNGVVFLVYPTRVHAKPEITRRCRRLRNQDNAAGLPIEAINNGYLSTGGDLKGEQVA